MAAPFKLDQALPITRRANGRFETVGRAQQLENPLETQAEGGTPADWAPGIDQGSARTGSPAIPWPDAVPARSPMKLNGG